MKDSEKIIGLIGFGAVGKLLYRTLLENNFKPEQIFVFDDKTKELNNSKCFKFNDYKNFNFQDVWFIPTLGYLSGELRLKVLSYLIENNKNIDKPLVVKATIPSTIGIN